jgi:hypothetical protein
MDPTFLEIRARASFRRVLAAVTLKQNQGCLATRSVKKDTPAARMAAGLAVSATPRPLHAVMNSLSRTKTCLDNAANAVILKKCHTALSARLGAVLKESGHVQMDQMAITSAVTCFSLLMTILTGPVPVPKI